MGLMRPPGGLWPLDYSRPQASCENPIHSPFSTMPPLRVLPPWFVAGPDHTRPDQCHQTAGKTAPWSDMVEAQMNRNKDGITAAIGGLQS